MLSLGSPAITKGKKHIEEAIKHSLELENRNKRRDCTSKGQLDDHDDSGCAVATCPRIDFIPAGWIDETPIERKTSQLYAAGYDVQRSEVHVSAVHYRGRIH